VRCDTFESESQGSTAGSDPMGPFFGG
jgi:hypothetical protein